MAESATIHAYFLLKDGTYCQAKSEAIRSPQPDWFQAYLKGVIKINQIDTPYLVRLEANINGGKSYNGLLMSFDSVNSETKEWKFDRMSDMDEPTFDWYLSPGHQPIIKGIKGES